MNKKKTILYYIVKLLKYKEMDIKTNEKFYKENEGWFIHEKAITVYFTKNESFWVFGMYLNDTHCIYEKKCHNWHDPDYFCNCVDEAIFDRKESNVDCAYID